MPTRRAIDLMFYHRAARMDSAARQTWFDDLDFNPEFTVALLDDLVASGAATDRVDAADVLRTDLFAAQVAERDPKQAARLRADLLERRRARAKARARVGGGS